MTALMQKRSTRSWESSALKPCGAPSVVVSQLTRLDLSNASLLTASVSSASLGFATLDSSLLSRFSTILVPRCPPDSSVWLQRITMVLLTT